MCITLYGASNISETRKDYKHKYIKKIDRKKVGGENKEVTWVYYIPPLKKKLKAKAKHTSPYTDITCKTATIGRI